MKTLIHNQLVKITHHAIVPAVALALLAAPAANAALTDLTSLVPAGQSVVFSEDFDNNDNAWSNVSPSGTGSATIGTDPLGSGESTWFPTSDTGGSGTSILTLTPTIDINAVNSFGVYFRTRIEANSDNNRFNLRVVEKESTANFTSLDIRPSSATRLNYRDKDGGQQLLDQGTGLITVADSFVNFRLDFVKTGSGTMSLTAYTYNTATTAWDQYNASTVDARFSTSGTNAGIFEAFQISATNGGETGRAVYDSFAIAVIPEPGTLSLVALAALTCLGFRARNRSRK